MTDKKFTLADAIAEQERTVRRLTTRLKTKLHIAEQKLAGVRGLVEAGKADQLNDLGELQDSGAMVDAAVAALYTADEARRLLARVQEAGES